MPKPYKYSSYRKIPTAAKGIAELAKVGKSVLKQMPIKKYTGRSLRGKSVKSDLSSLKKQVKNLSKVSKNTTATFVYRKRQVFQTSSTIGNAGYTDVAVNDKNLIETALTSVPYYESGALSFVNMADDAHCRELHFTSCTGKLTLRNNYTIPVKCKVTTYEIKKESSSLPNAFYTNGLTDMMSTALPNNPMFDYSDVPTVVNNWTKKNTKSFYIRPGQEKVYYHTVKDFAYDNSELDYTTSTYNKNIKSFVFNIRTEGPVSHDNTTSTLVNNSDTKLDCLLEQTLVLQYNGGAGNFKRYGMSEGGGAVLTAIVANQPAAMIQNQALVEGL